MTIVKQKLLKKVSPKGIAVWPRINGTPDTKFDDAGVWKITLRLSKDAKEVSDFIEFLEQQHAAAVEAAKKENPKVAKKLKVADQPWRDDTDEEGKETGDILINFKMKASGHSEKTGRDWTMQPMVVDAKGHELSAKTRVGGGSTVRVSFEIMPFYTAAVGAGISLRLNGVQVLDLVEGGKRSSADLGFVEEDGFEVSEDPATETADDAATGDGETKDEFAL